LGRTGKTVPLPLEGRIRPNNVIRDFDRYYRCFSDDNMKGSSIFGDKVYNIQSGNTADSKKV
jgi:hypothetical protein